MAVYKYRAFIQLEDESEDGQSSSLNEQRFRTLQETLTETEPIIRFDVASVGKDDCTVYLSISDQYTQEEMQKDAFSRLASREGVESAVFEHEGF